MGADVSGWAIGDYLISTVWLIWLFAWIVRNFARSLHKPIPRAADWIFFELRPLMPVIIVSDYLVLAITEGTAGIGWRILDLAFRFWLWRMSRHEKDDDDRWRKRRRRLADLVTVTPAGIKVAPARGRS